MGVFFFPYGSSDVCLQSAGSVHPFRTLIFPSSCESSRLCRKANPPRYLCLHPVEPAPVIKRKPSANPSYPQLVSLRHPQLHSAESYRAPGAAPVWGWETPRIAPCHKHTRGADASGLALDHVHHRCGQLLPSPLAATAGFGT